VCLLASGERSSKLKIQPLWLANQLKILSRRKSKDECYDPQKQTSKKARLYHPLFPFHSRESLTLMIAVLEQEVLKGQVLHRNNLETSPGWLSFPPFKISEITL
jgi:hypothetical protein